MKSDHERLCANMEPQLQLQIVSPPAGFEPEWLLQREYPRQFSVKTSCGFSIKWQASLECTFY